MVALNHAVAVAMSQGLQAGLDRIDRLGAVEPLDGYRLFHVARGELLRRLERREDSLSAYERALELTTNRVEQAYIGRRIRDLARV